VDTKRQVHKVLGLFVKTIFGVRSRKWTSLNYVQFILWLFGRPENI